MRVLHVYKDYYPVLGGIENHIKLLAEAQVQRGLEVTVLATSLARKSREETIDGVRVVKAGRLATVASTPLSFGLFSAFRRLVRTADLVHLHFPYPLGEMAYLAWGGSIPAVVTYHSDVVRQKGILALYRPLLGKFLQRAERIIATSPRYIESSPFLRQVREKCTVIPLGVELSRFARPDEALVGRYRAELGTPLLLFVGRLRYYKGLDYLLQALVGLEKARLAVVGSGPMETQWRMLATELGLGSRVAFLGEVSEEELPALYRAADVFVLPSSERSEAFGVVQVEAMAAGTPVVSTELGTGTSFVNRHQETGLVVPAREVEALREAIAWLLADPILRERMGRAGLARAQEFSLEGMVERTLALYAQVLKRP